MMNRTGAFLPSVSPSEAGEVAGEFVGVSARAGEIGLTIGLARVGGGARLGGETREMGRVGCACV